MGEHEGHEEPRRDTKMGTADYADWSRLGAGCRRQDCQNGMCFGGCGALPHAPAGRSSPCTPGTSCGRAQGATGKPSL